MMARWDRLGAKTQAAVLGALAALALPPLTVFPVLAVCVPGLLGLIARAPSRRRVFWIGYVFGFAHWMCGIYWITSAIIVEAAHYWWLVPFAVPGLCVILGVFTAVPCLVAWHARTPAGRAAAFAGAWVLSNLALQFFATGFPWNMWGSSLELPGYTGDVLIQGASLVGVHGLTLLVIGLAAAAGLGRRARIAGAAVFALWIGFGIWRLRAVHPVPTGVAVALVQGNVPEGQKASRSFAEATFQHYLDLTRTAAAEARALGPPARSLVVWPETASPFLLAEDAGARLAIAQAAGGSITVAGSIRWDGQTPYNSLVAVAPDGTVAGGYDKWHLVPFGEYQPSWLPGIQLVAGSFGFGPGPRSLHLPSLPPVGPLICYEAAFSGQIVDQADRPAWLLAVTNDAWFGNSSGPRQHLAAARLRAVEEGVPVMRAANTGISAGYDAHGHELGRIGMERAGVLVLALPGSLARTPYSRGGLFIPLVLAFLCLVGGLSRDARDRIRSY